MTAGWQFQRLWVLGIYPVFTLHAHQSRSCYSARTNNYNSVSDQLFLLLFSEIDC
jgi:hypothetical protein